MRGRVWWQVKRKKKKIVENATTAFRTYNPTISPPPATTIKHSHLNGGPERDIKKTGSFSLIERVILSAGAMLIFSVSFQNDQMPEGSRYVFEYIIYPSGGEVQTVNGTDQVAPNFIYEVCPRGFVLRGILVWRNPMHFFTLIMFYHCA